MVLLMSTPRFDLFLAIHKGIRLALADLLTRMGRADYADAGASERIALMTGALAVFPKEAVVALVDAGFSS